MLEPAAFHEIEGFLLLVEQPDLFAYLQVDRDASDSVLKSALRRRRSWAQGQQANPKYRTEALWLIKNIKLIQAAVIKERDGYLQETDNRAKQRNIGELRLFIQECLVEGTLPPEGEAEIMDEAQALGIPLSEVSSHIELVLTAADQGLLAELPMAPPEEERNHYKVLCVVPGTDQAGLEAAYRERYRWARNLRDTEESSRVYAELDAAWRVLKDPDQRAAYDQSLGIEENQTAEPEQIGLLPPPPPPPPEVPPPPSVSEPGEDEPPAPVSAPGGASSPPDAMDAEMEDDAAEVLEAAPEPDTEPQDAPLDSADGKPEETTSSAGSPEQDRNMDKPRVLDIGEIDDEALPILKVSSPPKVRIRTGNDPFPVRILIENAGAGQMSGSVSCREEWVEISPRHLNPNRREHSIEILVDPAKMPSNSAQATIEITTGHGESAEVIIDALQHLVSPKMKVVAAVGVLLGIAAVVGVYVLRGDIDPSTIAPIRTILAVHVDPPAGEVYVDDVMVGKQGTLSMVDNFPLDKPFQVRVELDGFEPWSKTVTIAEGQQLRIEADMVLRDPMDFKITPQMRVSDIDQGALKLLLERRAESFQNCFTRHLHPDSAYNAATTLRATVSQRGYVAAVDFRGANFESPEVLSCLKRQLRGVKLPVLPGDYASFDYTFRTRVGPRRAPVDIKETD
jgi:hypothetical protein